MSIKTFACTAKDRLTAKIKSVNKSLDGVKQATERVDLGLNTVKKDMGSVGQSASTMAKDLDKTKIALNGVKGSYMATVGLKDNATTKAKGIETTLKGIGGKVYTATVNIRQNGAERTSVVSCNQVRLLILTLVECQIVEVVFHYHFGKSLDCWILQACNFTVDTAADHIHAILEIGVDEYLYHGGSDDTQYQGNQYCDLHR